MESDFRTLHDHVFHSMTLSLRAVWASAMAARAASASALLVAFGQATLAVDTHVYRVSHRLGLVPRTANTPLKVEQTLLKYIDEADRPRAHHWLLLHGRYVCTSRAPHCDRCPLSAICPKLIEGSRLEH